MLWHAEQTKCVATRFHTGMSQQMWVQSVYMNPSLIIPKQKSPLKVLLYWHGLSVPNIETQWDPTRETAAVMQRCLSENYFCLVMLEVKQVYRRRQWHPTPVLLPGKSHGRRSLVGCSPWGRWGSGRTERLHFHFSLSRIGEGNGNPLQGSCLENPRDGGAWWAAVSGVAQSWTQLKWHRSSSKQVNRDKIAK